MLGYGSAKPPGSCTGLPLGLQMRLHHAWPVFHPWTSRAKTQQHEHTVGRRSRDQQSLLSRNMSFLCMALTRQAAAPLVQHHSLRRARRRSRRRLHGAHGLSCGRGRG